MGEGEGGGHGDETFFVEGAVLAEGAVDGAAYTGGLDGGGAGAGVVGLVEEGEDAGAGLEARDEGDRRL